MQAPQPALFLSHGSPDILLREHPAVDFLRGLGSSHPKPEKILVISAHWIDDPVSITTGDRLATIHDFGGFPEDLYRIEYPVRGDDALSERLSSMLTEKGIPNQLVPGRGLDHGAWVPLRLIHPDARIPVVQVSLPASPLQKLPLLGEALAPLRQEGVLIIGSGGSVHNLRALNREHRTDSWAAAFEAWLGQAVEENHFEWLIERERFPASFHQAHPTLEHYAPLVVAWAAAGADRPGRRLHQSFDYGNIGMGMFVFGEQRQEGPG